MNYKEAIRYLNSFQNLEKIKSYNYNKAHKTERFAKLCGIIGMPQYDFKSVLVAGTKGKGSVCAILYSILTQAGYRTGLYTSPHILDLRERIKINDSVITKEEFARLVQKIKEGIRYTRPDDTPLYKTLTFFELLTAVSFLYFSKHKVDIAVIEVGLGGRLDTTNILYPLVSIITRIGYDHTQLLGKTLEKIAKEKAGIIKENSFVVSASQDKKVIDVIKKVSKEKNNQLYVAGRDIICKCKNVSFNKTVFDCDGIYQKYKGIKVSLAGRHQAENASIALACIEILKHHFHFPISRRSISGGLESINWPGRFEILNKTPCIIADGAHNIDSAQALRRALYDVLNKRKIDSLVLGVSEDKDIKGIGSLLCPLAKRTIFTQSYSPRAASPKALLKSLSGYCPNSYAVNTPENAMSLAKRLTPDDGIILVTGSLYLVGDVIKKCKA